MGSFRSFFWTPSFGGTSGTELDEEAKSGSGVRLDRDRLKAAMNLKAVGGVTGVPGIPCGGGEGAVPSRLVRGVWVTHATSDAGLIG